MNPRFLEAFVWVERLGSVVSDRDDPSSNAAEGVATLIAKEAMRFASAVGPGLAHPLAQNTLPRQTCPKAHP